MHLDVPILSLISLSLFLLPINPSCVPDIYEFSLVPVSIHFIIIVVFYSAESPVRGVILSNKERRSLVRPSNFFKNTFFKNVTVLQNLLTIFA